MDNKKIIAFFCCILVNQLFAQINFSASYNNNSTIYYSNRPNDDANKNLIGMHGFAIDFGEKQENDKRSYLTFSYNWAKQNSDKMVTMYAEQNSNILYDRTAPFPEISNSYPFPIYIAYAKKDFNYQNTYAIVNIGFKRLWRLSKKSESKLKHYIGFNAGFNESTNALLVKHVEAKTGKYEKRYNESFFGGFSYMNEIKINNRFALNYSIDLSLNNNILPAANISIGLRYYFKFTSNLNVPK